MKNKRSNLVLDGLWLTNRHVEFKRKIYYNYIDFLFSRNMAEVLLSLLLVFQDNLQAILVKSSHLSSESRIVMVFLIEITKFFLSLFLFFKGKNRMSHEFPPYLHLFALPALIYSIQNNLRLFALEKLSINLYFLLTNLRIVSTGVFAKLLMNKYIHRLQWYALILLCVGATLSRTSTHNCQEQLNHYTLDESFWGFSAMLGVSLCSGLAGEFPLLYGLWVMFIILIT